MPRTPTSCLSDKLSQIKKVLQSPYSRRYIANKVEPQLAIRVRTAEGVFGVVVSLVEVRN